MQLKPTTQQENCSNTTGKTPNTMALAIPEQDKQKLGPDPPTAMADNRTTKDYGCVWDGPNYSCAFDAVFMATFSTYRYADQPWRQQWQDSSNFNHTLAGLFDNLLTTMQMPLLRRQLPFLFNMYRDQVHDHLNTLDTANFPRCGQILVAASDIFAYMCRLEGNHRLVRLKFTCSNETHKPRIKKYSATFVLVVHKLAPANHASTEKPTLQAWLSSYFREMQAVPHRCKTCNEPCSRSPSSVTPIPWIWIDIPPGRDQAFSLSTALTLEQESGSDIGYTLTGIIYVGGAHFSARWRDASGRWWAYDGMVDSGRPSLDPITNDTQLTILRNRVMHILIYRINPTDFASPA